MGVAVNNSGVTIILRGLVVMALCWVVGLLVGTIAQRTVQENIDAYKQAHEIPKAPTTASDVEDEVTEADLDDETAQDTAVQESSRSAA